jgi:hypothetical protein
MSSDRTGGVTSPAKTSKLIELIVEGLSVSEAAKQIGVSRRHAYRLVSDPEAKAAIQRAARESAASAQVVLQRGAEESARALVSMGTGKMKATPARVAACRGVLDYVIEKAAATLNVNATRMPGPATFEAMGAAAVALLEGANLEAETSAAQPADASTSGHQPEGVAAEQPVDAEVVAPLDAPHVGETPDSSQTMAPEPKPQSEAERGLTARVEVPAWLFR